MPSIPDLNPVERYRPWNARTREAMDKLTIEATEATGGSGRHSGLVQALRREEAVAVRTVSISSILATSLEVPAGGWHHSVDPQILDHLTVMIKGVGDGECSQMQAERFAPPNLRSL